MKKWGFLLLLLICLFVTFIYKGSFESKSDIPNIEVQKDDQHENHNTEDRSASDNSQQTNITEEQINQGNLLLVNNEHPVQQESIKSDVVDLSMHNELTQGYVLLGNENYMSKSLAHKFSEMVAGAGKDGLHNFALTSGFRSFEEQNILYEQMGSDRALPPGYSEHNLGLSLDVGSTQMKMEDAPEGEWIAKNAWKYGFVLRYPEDKTDITGIQYEPWHIRYVGMPHSAIMKEKGFVLEEYLDYLKEKKKVSAKVEGENYTISYYPVSENMTIILPKNHEYEISGDNMNGVIVTIYE
ncbi:VanY-A/VanY-F/VanY-M family D-Ala-D-Ala carboxypeptidase [Aquibacillus koreensis]|uniref:VanY-A/VanY-F/VanY-M family D-Ala-D-Ala carboxypeptidase n=1 Tax=Aquibacillus koreensis TaxID=279446 RepID=A0A9X3WHK9_9BACI|nr:VanY-A/VanY-F/VanY-M family D-Ala-D-Ala carboxypeptidase [Aquibacillus koreensis]MCT2537147.1 VanY-A/VanY-F/VanY-M family D-Ala-D-Ala carboxypeptidase [Aquibacillus koreensis]MDC3419870.1 VanY-A/VanY-F/VanY-M family D-Ala-D-Ala carboxypeptidase [Aquibacillus koreensis]